MDGLTERLQQLEKDISIGVIGIGSIGKGMVLQPEFTSGMRCMAICDIELKRAIDWAEELGRDYQVAETLDQLDNAILKGKLAVCQDGDLIARSEQIDVFIEATSSVTAGAQFALTAIEHQKHILMMNYEADLMYGPYLMRRAEEKGSRLYRHGRRSANRARASDRGSGVHGLRPGHGRQHEGLSWICIPIRP